MVRASGTGDIRGGVDSWRLLRTPCGHNDGSGPPRQFASVHSSPGGWCPTYREGGRRGDRTGFGTLSLIAGLFTAYRFDRKYTVIIEKGKTPDMLPMHPPSRVVCPRGEQALVNVEEASKGAMSICGCPQSAWG